MSKTRNRILPFILLLIIVVPISLWGGYTFGYQTGSNENNDIIISGIDNVDDKAKTADFKLFWEAWSKLKELHIKGASTTEQELLYGAISGLAGSFDDPHTVFFPPNEAKKFEEDITGNFGGIGAEIGLNKDKILIVIAPLKGSPAERAGILAGDFILKINEKLTQNMDVNQAVELIRGQKGTSVVLNIFRDNFAQPRDIVITRETIEIPTLDLEFKEGGIAYLQLYGFNENAPLAFYRATQEILAKKAKGIVLDMRNNPGGFLEVATHIAGYFLEEGSVVVSEKFRIGEDRVFKAEGSASLARIPAVILLNQGSASASEILAGAMHDNRKIKIVGERSFGKGTVQELTKLKDGSSLKITVAQWVLPNGHILEGNGLDPDIKIELTDEDIKNKNDLQLVKALEVLKSEIK